MFVQIEGTWIDTERPSRHEDRERKPQPISWPFGEDGTVLCKLVDSITRAPILLNLPTDTITLRIGFDVRSGARYKLVGVAPTLNAFGPGMYQFTIPASTTKQMSGPWVYDVQVVRGGTTQIVTALAYFNVDSTV